MKIVFPSSIFKTGSFSDGGKTFGAEAKKLIDTFIGKFSFRQNLGKKTFCEKADSKFSPSLALRLEAANLVKIE